MPPNLVLKLKDAETSYHAVQSTPKLYSARYPVSVFPASFLNSFSFSPVGMDTAGYEKFSTALDHRPSSGIFLCHTSETPRRYPY